MQGSAAEIASLPEIVCTPVAAHQGKGVMNLPGPPSVQATSKKINALKRRAQEIARDQES
jgi:hypothetical protein